MESTVSTRTTTHVNKVDSLGHTDTKTVDFIALPVRCQSCIGSCLKYSARVIDTTHIGIARPARCQ
jgi:hypothetical protein